MLQLVLVSEPRNGKQPFKDLKGFNVQQYIESHF